MLEQVIVLRARMHGSHVSCKNMILSTPFYFPCHLDKLLLVT